jgi:proline dehydrogenase
MSFFNSFVVASLPYVPRPIVGLLAKRYIAGDSLQDAVNTCQHLHKMGAMATIDLLGEQIKDAQKASETVEIYMQIWEAIAQNKLNANISLKPTSYGAIFDAKLCQANISKVVEKAAALGNWLTIDMEDHPYTDLTLYLYETLRKEFPKTVGTVLQAYLMRTYDDAARLSKNGQPTNLRLCKGIYKEPASIAYQKKQDINENYLKVLDLLLSRGAYIGIATHDNFLVDGALRLIEKYKLNKDQYEFQMLLGVRPELRKRLLSQGQPLRIYTPFGKDWYAYSVRRLKENPAIAGNVVRGLLRDYK